MVDPMSPKFKHEFSYFVCFLFALFGLSLTQSNLHDIRPAGVATIHHITTVQNSFGKITAYRATSTKHQQIAVTKKDYQAWLNSPNQYLRKKIYLRYDGKLAVWNLRVDWRFLLLFLGLSLLVCVSYVGRLILKLLFMRHPKPLFQNLVRLDLMVSVLLGIIGLSYWNYANYLEPLGFTTSPANRQTAVVATVVGKHHDVLHSQTRYGRITTEENQLNLRYTDDWGITQNDIHDVSGSLYTHSQIKDELPVYLYKGQSGGLTIKHQALIIPGLLPASLIILNFVVLWFLPSLLPNFGYLVTHLQSHTKFPAKRKHLRASGLILLSFLIFSVGHGFLRATLTPQNTEALMIKTQKKTGESPVFFVSEF